MYFSEFRNIGIDCPTRNSGDLKVVCPECEKRKGGTREKDLSINYDKGVYNCHSEKCDFKGTVVKSKFSRPKLRNETKLNDKIVDQFLSRGISQKTLVKAGITTNGNNIEFNYFRNKALINVKTRFKRDGKKGFSQHKGAEKIPYNLDSIIGKKNAIICEGEIDVLSFIEAGIPEDYGVISVDQGAGKPGSKMDGKLECIKNTAKILDEIEGFYICVDDDEPGRYLAEELIRRLGSQRCYNVILPNGKKDANEVLDNKGNEMSLDARKSTLRNALAFAKPVPMNGVHELDDDTWELMEHQYYNGRAKGKTTHFPDLDEKFTFLAGDLTLITGIPNHGKSQFCRELMVLKAKNDGWKFGVYAPEDWPIDYFFEDLCHIYLGNSTDKANIYRPTFYEFSEAMLFVKEHFFCVYPEKDKKTGIAELPTPDWIAERFQFLKLKYGINAVCIDPWNKIFHNITHREDQYLAKELSKQKFIAAQFDAYMIVAHPSKMIKNGVGDYEQPTAYSISGGAMWNNQVDNILVVHRPLASSQADDTSVEVSSVKIKKKKIVGQTGTAYFNFEWKKAQYIQASDGFNPLTKKEEIKEEFKMPRQNLEEIPF